ncbi:hypothetical protein SD074_04920 [Prolixibacter sp. SD074]|nr:hypothetical protein SD074_04920 [Prolixibacter sp. SD074]
MKGPVKVTGGTLPVTVAVNPIEYSFEQQRVSPTRIKTQLGVHFERSYPKKGSKYANLPPFFRAQLCLNS